MIPLAIYLCLALAGHEVSLELRDNPVDVTRQAVKFSQRDAEHIATELRAMDFSPEEVRSALAPYKLVPTRTEVIACGTCSLGIYYPAKKSCGSYYGNQWCIHCAAPCPPDPMPIAVLRLP